MKIKSFFKTNNFKPIFQVIEMFFVSERKFKPTLCHTVMMHCFSLNASKAKISRALKLFEIYDLDALEPQHFKNFLPWQARGCI
jgi:hypothetical protein